MGIPNPGTRDPVTGFNGKNEHMVAVSNALIFYFVYPYDVSAFIL